MHIPPPILELWNALCANLGCWCIVLVLNALGLVLQKTPIFPNKYNWLIPWLLYVGGIVGAELVISPDVFPPSQPHPRVMLAGLGFIFGCAAYFGHDFVLQWVLARIKKYVGTETPPQ